MKKHCLFCNELIDMKQDEEFDRYSGCMCAPNTYYHLSKDAYSHIQAFSYAKKRQVLPIVSAYIRERAENGERLLLTPGKIEEMMVDPDIPMTTEEKEKRLLQYLYRRTEAAMEPVNLHPLSKSYNLTYSTNLQEFVYIMEKLRETELLVREGSILKLTDQGWSEAAAFSGGGKRKLFSVMVGDEQIGLEWSAQLLPGLEQCGYDTRLLLPSSLRKQDSELLEALAESHYILADLTGAGPEVYFAAGYAAKADIPLTWTVRADQIDSLLTQSEWIRPIPWEDTEELVQRFQLRR
ncbi:hypothetical protein [Paenibacillus sp. NPDC057967]|uniref:hypothetical protein n=1 Tax=Paenibacillus sp. NPDC057967 TaxID=3346293 RepID=UPI0036D91BF4